MTGLLDEELRVAQIRLHRAIAGGRLVPGFDHLGRAAKETEHATEATVKMWREQTRYETRYIVEAEEKSGREAIEQFAGAALVMAQRQISLITTAIGDIGEACKRQGYGTLQLAERVNDKEPCDAKLRKRMVSIGLINGAANFWKHGHEEPLNKWTLEALAVLGVDPKSPTAVQDMVKALNLDLESPNHHYMSLWAEVKEWGEALLPDLFQELERMGVLMLTTYSEVGGEVWQWKQSGIEILTHEVADLYRD